MIKTKLGSTGSSPRLMTGTTTTTTTKKVAPSRTGSFNRRTTSTMTTTNTPATNSNNSNSTSTTTTTRSSTGRSTNHNNNNNWMKLGNISAIVIGILLLSSILVNFCSDRWWFFIQHHVVKDITINSQENSVDTGTTTRTSSKDKDNNKDKDDDDSTICTIPILQQFSTRRIWMEYISQIHMASRLEEDIQYLRHDYTTELLALITPRLDHSIKTSTKDWKLVSRLLQKAYRRYVYLVQQQQEPQPQHDEVRSPQPPPPPPPPIRITVLGGSVALGIQCRTGIPGMEYDEMNTRNCAWPHRLQTFINQFFNVGVLVEVSNEAVGGTYSSIGTSILKYDLIEGILDQSDILIHAYSTNDSSHVSTKHTNTERFLSTLQEFCRLVFQPPRYPICQIRKTTTTTRMNHDTTNNNNNNPSSSSPYQRPFLIHLDDVLTPYKLPLVKYASMPRVVSSLANYYGFVSLSYVDMVRDYVWGDPKETWFSANEFPDDSYRFDVHPGQGMHIATSWMVAYSMLHITSTFCTLNNEFWRPRLLQQQRLSKKEDNADIDDNPFREDDEDEDKDDYETQVETAQQNDVLSYMFVADYDSTVLRQSMPLKHNGTADQTSEGIPPRLPPPQGLLPALDSEITMNDLNAKWKAETKQLHLAQHRPCPRGSNNGQALCPFAWVSGHDQFKNMSWVKEHVLSRLTKSTSWTMDLQYNFRKMGLTPPMGEVGATMNLEFPLDQLDNMSDRPITTVVIFYLKSYGATWKDSRARIEIFKSQESSLQMDTTKGTLSSEEEMKQWELLVKTELVGSHKTLTSEMYLKEIDLGTKTSEDDPGGNTANVGTLRVQATLVDGQTFKIMGLALCHS